MAWRDPLVPVIPIPDDLKSHWYRIGSARYQLLPKQYEFLAAPEEFISYVGGVGCKAASAKINGVPIPEWSGGYSSSVLGRCATSRSVLKGRTDLYRVETVSGQATEVTVDHRFLTPTGWKRLRDLAVGDVLAVCDIEDGLSAAEIRTSSKARYSRGSRPYDELLPPDVVAALDIWLQGSGLQCETASVLEDLQKKYRLSMNGFCGRTERHHYDGLLQAALTCAESLLRLRRRQYQVPHNSLQLCSDARDLQQGDESLYDSRPFPDICQHGAELLTHRLDAFQEILRQQPQSHTGDKLQLPAVPAFDPMSRMDAPYSYFTTIKSVSYIRNGEFWDVTVPGIHSYISDGFVDHNSGKTRVGSIRSTYLSMHPNNRGLVGRFALPDLEDTTQRDLLDFLQEAQLLKEPPNSKNKRALVHCIDPIAGKNLGYTSEITFQHLDDPDHLRGRHLGWFWIDEGSELRSTKAWTTLVGRLRHPTFKGRYKAVVTGNPKGHNWIFDFFFNQENLTTVICNRPGCPYPPKVCNEHIRKKRRAIHCTSWENYFLPPDYLENMVASFTDEQRRREIEAEFDVFEGQVFKEFRRDIHVIQPPESWIDGRPPKEWNRLLAVDVGGSSPWAFIWCAVDPVGNLIFYDEIYMITSNVDQLAELALPKMKDENRNAYNFQAKVIDYENKIAAEDLRRRGIAFSNARKMNKSGDGGSVSRLSSYLHPNPKHHYPEYHHLAGQPYSPRAFITTACPNLIRELPQQQWETETVTDRLRDTMDRRIDNHAVDCALYISRELPHPAELKPVQYQVTGHNKSKISEMYWYSVKQQQEREKMQQGRRPYRIQRTTLHMVD